MKSILYVGATLMIGASVYGFVDYNKTSHNKEFKNLYTDTKKKEQATVAVTNEIHPAIEKATMEKTSPVVHHKETTARDKTDVVLKPGIPEKKMVTEKPDILQTETVTTNPSGDSSEVKPELKKRKFSARLFSRAPLKDVEETKPASRKEEKKSTQ